MTIPLAEYGGRPARIGNRNDLSGANILIGI
jgi:hypothetical protein